MSNEKEKYANGDSLDASKMSKEEKRKAIEYWCEGNKQLKKLLLYFNEEDIETVGCCSGHDKNLTHPIAGSAYVAIMLGKKTDDKVLDLLSKAEENNIDMNIAFVRGIEQRKFCILCSEEGGFNEAFFEQLNTTCSELEQGEPTSDEIKEKYKMLRVLLIDERITKETEDTEYSFQIGDNDIRTLGFLEYGYNIINIPIKEVERMGRWLCNNPEVKLPSDFCGEKITRKTYPLEWLKEKARASKFPLKSINQAYEWIRNAIKSKEVTKEVKEGCVR